MGSIMNKATLLKEFERVLSKYDFSESDMEGTKPCAKCGWPCFRDTPPYQSADHGKFYTFHVVARFGEQSRCQEALWSWEL